MSDKLTKEDKEIMEGHNEPITKDELIAFVKELEKNDTDTSKLSGDRSAIFARAEKAGIHKDALKHCMKLHRMDEASRIYYLESHDKYSEMLGLREEKQTKMKLEVLTPNGKK